MISSCPDVIIAHPIGQKVSPLPQEKNTWNKIRQSALTPTTSHSFLTQTQQHQNWKTSDITFPLLNSSLSIEILKQYISKQSPGVSLEAFHFPEAMQYNSFISYNLSIEYYQHLIELKQYWICMKLLH